MLDTNEKIERLEKIIGEASESHPHSRDIIHAFAPFLLEKASLMGSLDFKDHRTMAMDELQFKNGVPLLRQNEFSPVTHACEFIAMAILPPLETGFQKLSTDLEKLRAAIMEKKIGFADLLVSSHEEAGGLIETWALHEDVSVEAVRLALMMVAKVYFEKTARTLAPLIKDFAWDKGYCPICGSAPMIAKIRDKIGTRHLYCSQCAHEWVFSRVICPSCGRNKQSSMTYFFVDDKSRESAFVCEECGRYLITMDKVSDLVPLDADISALSLVHLDVIMQGKGYLPMAACAWNSCS
ncbi:MAG: formate dehydrogenase accessory protein FdhE [Desulfomonilia bacterium]